MRACGMRNYINEAKKSLQTKDLFLAFAKRPVRDLLLLFSPVGLREMGRRDFPLGCEAKIVTR
jgi:hypothetical protein